MRIERYYNNLSLEALEALEDKLEEAREDAAEELKEDGVNEELPEELETLNPIEADQAIEISNNHPTEVDTDNYTNYEKIMKISDAIDDASIVNEDKIEVSATLGRFNVDEDPVTLVHESLQWAYQELGITPASLSVEDIYTDPNAGIHILRNEQQVLKKAANDSVWATIKEDCKNIVQLIDTIIKTIVSKKDVVDALIPKITDGEIVNREYDLSVNLHFVGSLRYFIATKERKGDLVELIAILKDIMNEQSPKLTSEDNTIFKSISVNKPGSLLEADKYVRNEISIDSLNLKLLGYAKRNPNLRPVELYSRVTGNNTLEALINGVRSTVTISETYTDFLLETEGLDVQAFKNDIIETLTKFPIKFNNHFLLFKKKYEAIEQVMKPLIMPGASLEDNVKFEEASKTLSLIRFYYIEFVKDRLVDKVNAYQSLIDLSNRIFKQK